MPPIGGGGPAPGNGGLIPIIGGAIACGGPRGIIFEAAGAPTPGAAPPKPAAAAAGAERGIPLPAALPAPGKVPAPAPAAPPFFFSPACLACGGGPSTARDRTSSPRSSTRPSTRRCERGSFSPLRGGRGRCSSQSPRTRFMCLSKAMKLFFFRWFGLGE